MSRTLVSSSLLVVVALGCGSKQEKEAAPAPATPAPSPTVKEPAPSPVAKEPTPPPAPAADARKKVEVTKDGIGALALAKPMTFAELKKLPGGDVVGPLSERRGGKQVATAGVTVADRNVTVVFPDKTKPFSWFEITSFDDADTTCLEGICLGDSLDKAKALAGATCKPAFDGQGFSVTYACGKEGSSLVVLGGLPNETRQDHPLNEKRDGFPLAELVAANGHVRGFAWLTAGAKWGTESYDEGDR